jgi:hypothetical protein
MRLEISAPSAVPMSSVATVTDGGCPIVTPVSLTDTRGKMLAPIPVIATGCPSVCVRRAATAVRTVSPDRTDCANTKSAAAPASARMIRPPRTFFNGAILTRLDVFRQLSHGRYNSDRR